MNLSISQWLNQNAYPVAGKNARSKYLPKNSQVTIAAGANDYMFFDAALTNPLTANMRLPISGSEVFFVDRISCAYDFTDILTGTIYDEIMQSYLLVTVNDRILYKTSLASILNFGHQALGVASAQIGSSVYNQKEKQFNNPIIINSTSNVQFKLHLTTAAATALDTQFILLTVQGWQFDKLSDFEYNDLQNKQFQRIDWDFYEIQAVTVGAAATYTFFQNTGQADTLYSKLFPLAESEMFQVQAIQVMFSDQNTVAPDFSLWFPRMKNRLTINVNDVIYSDGFISKALSFYGKYVTAAENNGLALWQNDVIKTPIIFPAKGNTSVQMLQGADTTPAAGFVMMRLQGELTRRVA